LISHRPLARRLVVAALLLVLGAAVAVVAWWRGEPRHDRPAGRVAGLEARIEAALQRSAAKFPPAGPALAVLPFAAPAGDAELASIGDSMPPPGASRGA
jgi:hypothetical protein